MVLEVQVNKMGDTIVIVSTDDWEGLYLNNKLMLEGHQISVDGAMEYIVGRTITEYKGYWIEPEVLEQFDDMMPDNLNKLKGNLKR